MFKKNVDSSFISAIAHDEIYDIFSRVSKLYHRNTYDIYIIFSSGKIFKYFDVPLTVIHEFFNVHSIGRYYNNHIKGIYPSESISKLPSDNAIEDVPNFTDDNVRENVQENDPDSRFSIKNMISIFDKMPGLNVQVVFRASTGTVFCGSLEYYEDSNMYVIIENLTDTEIDIPVTHWAPLPF